MHSRGILLLLSLCCAIIKADHHVVNIATNKTYRQISDYPYKGNASNAADGNTAGSHEAYTCSHTDVTDDSVPVPDPYNEYHWWEVDLGRIYPVDNITVWARNGLSDRLYPFTITVDNQTCVSMVSDPGTRRHSVRCTSVMYGQVVRLTLMNKPETLNLCELQIFVPSGVSQCPAGRHGANCSQTCSDNCGGGSGNNFCYQDTGICYDDCKDGHWGPEFCHKRCSSGCTSSTCQRDNGSCTGCDRGYHGANCTKQCATQTARCAECEQQSGTCTACDPNFELSACTDCTQGYYKSQGMCKQCSNGCTNRQCDRGSGRCNACLDGRYGHLCTTPCSPGCARCDQTSGNCNACTIGSNLVLPGCTDCAQGYYKSEEECQLCSAGCKNGQCDSKTGRCDVGVVDQGKKLKSITNAWPLLWNLKALRTQTPHLQLPPSQTRIHHTR